MLLTHLSLEEAIVFPNIQATNVDLMIYKLETFFGNL